MSVELSLGHTTLHSRAILSIIPDGNSEVKGDIIVSEGIFIRFPFAPIIQVALGLRFSSLTEYECLRVCDVKKGLSTGRIQVVRVGYVH
jgi:hypothetical protein